MKKIVFVSGTRADFGKISPLALEARTLGFTVKIFVTGMHMLNKYGLTKHEVHRSFDDVTEFLNQREGDSLDTILCKTISGFSDYIKEEEPDLVVVHGDRIEAFACSISCATNYVRCVHVEGGEVSGTIDEIFRHCNTKLCTAHLVSSSTAKARVESLGEEPERIFNIGSPELDIHQEESGISLLDVKARYNIPFDNYGVCIFHPVTSELDTMQAQAKDLFDALSASGRHFVVIMPNNDPGSEGIFEAIGNLRSDHFRTLPSMRFNHFSELLKNACVIVGNSSTGVREAPFLGVPSLNVGTRQKNRSGAASIFNTAAGDANFIQNFLQSSWGMRFDPQNDFGSGSARGKFAELLKSEVIMKLPYQKIFTDKLPNA